MHDFIRHFPAAVQKIFLKTEKTGFVSFALNFFHVFRGQQQFLKVQLVDADEV